MRGPARLLAAATLAALLALIAAPAAAQSGAKLVNTPAETFVTAPGGVDMRTGRFVYNETDLAIGGEGGGGLSLSRILTANVLGHANPFANLSHNWDIMVSELRINADDPQAGGQDFQINVHFGGRSQTYRSRYGETGFQQMSSGPWAPLTYAGDRADPSVVYSQTAADGTVALFRALGNGDCSNAVRCAYVSEIVEPDGTKFTFFYAATGSASGGAQRLARVTSSRGYALLLEGSGPVVTRACLLNLALTAIPAGGLCPDGVPTATYVHAGGRLVSATGPDNAKAQFHYGTAPYLDDPAGSTTMGFVRPGETTPWLINRFHTQPDELEVPQEIVDHQAFADGQSYSYGYDFSPAMTDRPRTIAGGHYTNALSQRTGVKYAWPLAPGANYGGSPCRSLPCTAPRLQDRFSSWTYQQTPGPVAITDPLGRSTGFGYCDAAAMADPNWIEANRCIVLPNAQFVVDPEGIRTDLRHDGHGNVILATRHPKPGVLNPDGTAPAPIVTSAVYAAAPSKAANKPLSMTDGRGNTTRWTYVPAHGGVETETGPEVDGITPQKRYVYVQRQARLSNGDFAGPAIYLLERMSFCRTGNPSGSGCALGAADEVVTAYDYGPESAPGNLLPRGQAVSADGVTLRTCYAYDALGRKVSETSPSGTAGLAACPVTAPTTALSYTTSTRYDADNRVTGTIAPDPDPAPGPGQASGPLPFPAVRNSYDPAGRLTRVEQGALAAWQSHDVAPANWADFAVHKTVDTQYDALDRKVRDAVSGGGVTTHVSEYSYDLAGRLKCTAVRMNPAEFALPPRDACVQGTLHAVNGPDRIAWNVYDAAGQLVEARSGVGTNRIRSDAFEYNPNGQRRSLTDARGYRAEMTYDAFGRQSRWIFPSKTSPGVTNPADYEEYGHDPAGNRTRLRKRDGQELLYTYDALNRVTLKDSPGPTADVRYSYDLRGLQTAAWFTWTGHGIANTWDGFGRIVSTTSNMGGVSRTVSHLYDREGREIELGFPDGQRLWFARDGLGRMTHAHQGALGSPANAMIALAYDERGLRSSVARKYGDTTEYGYDRIGRPASIKDSFAGAIGDVQWTFPAYSPADQLMEETRDNDAYAWSGAVPVQRGYAVNGLNQYTAAGPATFGYDPNGNLTSDGTRTYLYDVENRLVSATSAGVTATLVYDPLGRLFQVSSGAGVTQFLHDGDELVAEYNASGTLLRRYVHGDGDDDPLFWYEGSGLTQPRFPHADRHGSIVAVAGASGAIHAINNYDEYGIPGAGNSGRFQYTGQAWLAELGLYYYKARIYSPTLGRFLQTDPVGYDDQINLYAYVANDPVNGRDPDGTQSDWTMDRRYIYPHLSEKQRAGLDEEHRKTGERAATGVAIGASLVPIGRAAIGALSWAARAVGIGQRVAAPTIEAAAAALPQGVTRHVFAKVGVWRTEGGVAAAATRSRAVSSEAIQGLKDAGVSRGAVRTWQKFYQGAVETVKSDGTKVINETARYRAEVLQDVLKKW